MQVWGRLMICLLSCMFKRLLSRGGLGWTTLRNCMGFKWDKTVEVARQQCKEMVVGSYMIIFKRRTRAMR